MPAMLPPALEALMRMQGREGMVPTEEDVGAIGMPTGMPFSNQAPHQTRRTPMDGSLGMLSALISGLSGHAGPEMQQPEPQTMVIRPAFSPGEFVNNQGAPEPYRHVGGIGPSSESDALIQQLEQQAGGGRQIDPMMFRRPNSSGIVDPAKYASVYGPQGSYTQDQNARQDLVRQRAMQVGQARTNRQSGMDPRTAALLAALGGDEGGMGQMVLADQLLGRGSGLELNKQQQDAAIAQQMVDAKTKDAGATATPPAAAEGGAGPVTSGRLEDINKANPAATSQESAIRGEAAKIYDRHIKGGAKPSIAASYTARELMDRHGITRPEAERIASMFSGEAAIPREPMQPGEAGSKGPLSGNKSAWEDPVGSLAEWLYRNTQSNAPKR